MSAAYQNTTDAMEIAVKALFLAASNAKLEGAPPSIISNLRAQATRLSAMRHEIVSGRAAAAQPIERLPRGLESLVRSTLAAGENGWTPKRDELLRQCRDAARKGILVCVSTPAELDRFKVADAYLPPSAA